MSFRTYTTILTTLFLVAAIVTIAALGLSAQSSEMYADSVRKLELALNVMSELVRTPLQERQEEELSIVASRVARAEMVFLVLIADSDGNIIASSEDVVASGKIPPDLIPVDHPTEIRLEQDQWLAIRSVIADDALLGYVYVQLDGRAFVDAIERVKRRAAISGLVAVMLGAVLAYFFGGLLGKSFLPLRQALRAARSGDLSARVPPSQLSEIHETGQVFNQMTAKLRQRMRESGELNKLVSDLTLASGLEETFDLVASTCERLTGGVCFIWIKNHVTGRFEQMRNGGISLQPTEDSIASKVMFENRWVTIGTGDSEYPSGSDLGIEIRPEVGVMTPLTAPVYGNVGFMVISLPPGIRKPEPEHVDLALALANAAAPAIAALQRTEVRERAAETLAEMLLPPPPMDVPVLDVAARYRPVEIASGLGGDYYDFILLGDEKWGLAIGDVAGKGVQAAQYTSMAKYAVRAYALEGYSPARTLDCANEALLAQASIESFITILYMTIDLRSQLLTFSSAGHTPALLYQVDTGICIQLYGSGPGVGIVEGIEYTETAISLHPGDILVLMTDGVTEARRGCEFYGMERAESVVIRQAHNPAADIARGLLDDILAFSRNELSDDVAIVVVKIESPPIP